MEIQTDNPNKGYPFPCFSYDSRNSVALNTAYIMCSNSVDVRYVLGILNSTVGRMIARLYVTQLQERQYRMLSQYISKFPIAKSTSKIQAVLKEGEYIAPIPTELFIKYMDLNHRKLLI